MREFWNKQPYVGTTYGRRLVTKWYPVSNKKAFDGFRFTNPKEELEFKDNFVRKTYKMNDRWTIEKQE